MTSEHKPIHKAAARGYARASAAYESGRPDYPAAIDTWLRDTLGLSTQRAALDLGAGTGKFTSRLVATGADVSAVEPVDAMRKTLEANHPDVRSLAGSAEAIALEDASIDVVACSRPRHP